MRKMSRLRTLLLGDVCFVFGHITVAHEARKFSGQMLCGKATMIAPEKLVFHYLSGRNQYMW